MGKKSAGSGIKQGHNRTQGLADVLCKLAKYWMICECALKISVTGLDGWRHKGLQLGNTIDALKTQLAGTKSPSKKKPIQAELDQLMTQSEDLDEEWRRTFEETQEYEELFETARRFCTRSCGLGDNELLSAAIVGFDPELLPPDRGPSKARMAEITAGISSLPRDNWALLPWANVAKPKMRATRRVCPNKLHSFRLQQLQNLNIALEAPSGEIPYLGLIFHDNWTVSRMGDAYSDLASLPIELSRQQFNILKYIHAAGLHGRTKSEMDNKGFTSLKQEKQKIKEKLIPIGLTFAPRQHKLIHGDLR